MFDTQIQSEELMAQILGLAAALMTEDELKAAFAELNNIIDFS